MSDATRFARHLAGAEPGFANGGVVAGTLAHHLGGPTDRALEVRLHRPIPLERPLELDTAEDQATLRDGDVVLATARRSHRPIESVGPVGADAARASRPVVSVDAHPAPGCFVCGPTNRRGLNLQPGAIGGRHLVATTWSPPSELADARGELPSPIVWAALDCPSWYGAARGASALLGTIAARCDRPVLPGTPLIVSGWRVRREGRKTMAGSAIHGVNGELFAAAASTWIHPKEHHR